MSREERSSRTDSSSNSGWRDSYNHNNQRSWHRNNYHGNKPQRNSDGYRNDRRGHRNDYKSYRPNSNYRQSEYDRHQQFERRRSRWDNPHNFYCPNPQNSVDYAADNYYDVFQYDIIANQQNFDRTQNLFETAHENRAFENETNHSVGDAPPVEKVKNDNGRIGEEASSTTDPENPSTSVASAVATSSNAEEKVDTNCKLVIPIKEESNETDINETVATTDSDTTHNPAITLVPLSQLLDPSRAASANQENEKSKSESQPPPESSHPPAISSVEFPFKEPERISKKLINQVATMDKANIRNVINNPIQKFDAALKMQAQKRLREEIRKQLLKISVEAKQAAAQKSCELRPDEFVDADRLPQELLRQTIYKSIMNINLDGGQSPLRPDDENRDLSSGFGKKIDAAGAEVSLRTKLLNFEFVQQQAILRKCRSSTESDTTSLDRKDDDDDDDVCIVETPQETVTILHDDDDDDTSSDSCTTSSSVSSCNEPRFLGKFLDTFKKNLVPKLPENIRCEYENMSRKGETLSKIYNMCIEKLSEGNAKGAALVPPAAFNVTNSDEAVEFLLQNIQSLLDQRSDREKEWENERKRKQDEKALSKKAETGSLNRTDSSNKENGPNKSSSCNKERDKRQQLQTRPDEKRSTGCNSISKNPNKRDEIFAQYSSKWKPTDLSDCRIDDRVGDTSTKSSRIQSDKKKAALPEDHRKQQPDPLRSPENLHSFDNEKPRNERSWRSPGEKKCLSASSVESEPCRTKAPSPPSRQAEIKEQVDDLQLTVASLPDPNKADSIDQVNSLEIAVISKGNNSPGAGKDMMEYLKVIDSKLMNLNKRKVHVEKDIIRLQKKKMEIDLTTMQLQSDRFALISLFMSSSNNFQSPCNLDLPAALQLPPPSSERPKTGYKRKAPFRSQTAKKKRSQTAVGTDKKKSNFAEKLKNRKKRCQRDILIEHAAATLFKKDDKRREEIRTSPPSELQARIENIFTMPTRRASKPIQAVSPEKSKNLPAARNREKSMSSKKSNDANDSSLLPVSCIGNSINIIDNCDSSDDETTTELNPSNNGFQNMATGPLTGFRLPVVQIIGIEGYIICASEDGNIYKYDSSTKQLIAVFTKHTEAVTQVYFENGCIYSTSLDGFLKKTSVENFGLELLSVNLHEPLQTITMSWNIAFVGSRWGNIFTYNTKKNQLSDRLLCSVGSAITALKATKEGPRKVLIICSKGEKIDIRDASTGLLLRIMEIPSGSHVCSIVMQGSRLYCGTNGNQILTYDFTNGNKINTFICGTGTVPLQMFENKFLFAGCYDGFVYVLDKESGHQIGRFPGAGKIIVALHIIGDKLLTSSKDNVLAITDIPNYIQALTK